MKRFFDHPTWNHAVNFIAIMILLEFVVFPALTASSTAFNIAGLFVGIGLVVYTGIYIQDNFIKDKN